MIDGGICARGQRDSRGEATRHCKGGQLRLQWRKKRVFVPRHDADSTFCPASSLGCSAWRWRTCERRGGGEAINDDHQAAAVRAVPDRGFSIGGSLLVGGGFACGAEKVKAERQQAGPLAIGEEAKVPNADEAGRQRVK